MLKNYLKIALRNLKAHKSFSVINITGLTIGMVCFILIMLWVQDEICYDRFHNNHNEIYRIIGSAEVDNERVRFAYLPRPLVQALTEDTPGIINASVFASVPDELLVRQGDKKFFEKNIASVDPSFFNIFSFSFVMGNQETALKEPYTIVLTEDMAHKYFENQDPINKSIEVNNILHKVTGVIKNVPSQSHMQFDILTSYHLSELYRENDWRSLNWPVYVHIQKNADTQQIIQKINMHIKKHTPDVVEQMKMDFSLQSLNDIHLNPHYAHEYAVIGDSRIVYMIGFVALLILLIACANFINLSTAMATNRAKEISLRKVVGSSKNQLIIQLFGECIITTCMAFLMATIIVELILPEFNQYFGKTLAINFFRQSHFLTAIGLILITGIISGSYPAFFLASFNPVCIMKDRALSGVSKSGFRKILVIAQFAISIGLIICTILVKQQFSFLLNKDLGFDKENILCIPVKGQVAENYQVIKNDLLYHPNISNVTVSNYLPTDLPNQTVAINWEGKQRDLSVLIEIPEVDYDYFATLNLSFVAGRNFFKEFKTDADGAFIVNEEAIKQMGLTSPIGKSFSLYDRQGKIIGVVKNAHFRSLQYKIAPQVFTVFSDLNNSNRATVLIKVKTDGIQNTLNTIAAIGQVFQKYNPEYPFEYHFLDDNIENFYNDIKRISHISNYFTLLAIIIASLGLFGLVSFTIRKRTKEIGVRKVMGASTPIILSLLVKDFTKWILLSNLIAWPIAYYAVSKWLQNFAYRIEMSWPREITGLDFLKMIVQDPITGLHFFFNEVFISQGWWVFILAGVVALLIALLTVSWQVIRAATANPVESLRYE